MILIACVEITQNSMLNVSCFFCFSGMRDSPKVNVFCVISKNNFHGQFFLEGNVTGDIYLQMLPNWVIDKLIVNEYQHFIFEQDPASPHCVSLFQ